MLALISCGPSSQPSSSEPASEQPGTSEVVSENPTTSETPATSEPVEEVVSVQITNKADLTAEWSVGSKDRTVNLALDPAGNVNALIASGKVTVTSSNTKVVSVAGRILRAVGAGTATITVTYGDKSDSVEITVIGEKTAIDLYGTVHAGTLVDPLDNEDAIKVAEKTGTTKTDQYFYVKGTVESFRDAPSSYGNVSYYLKPAAGKTVKFLVYRVTLENNGKVTDNDIWVGAEVTAKVKIVTYNNIPETDQGGEIVKVEGTKPEIKTHEVTVAEAVAACKAMGENTTSTDKYIITGYIIAVDSSGFYLGDTKGKVTPTQDDFLVYGYSGANKEECTLNAKVKVTCTLKYYVSTSTQGKYNVETGNIETVEILEAGDAPVVLEEITTTKALEIINGLEDGATSDKEYIVTGYVKEVTTAYSTSYKNMSLTLGETKDATDLLTVFRAKLASGTSSDDVAEGAKIKVSCYLQKFVKDGVVTPEATKGTITVVEKAQAGVKNVTVAQAVAAALKLASNGVSTDEYVITGYVTSIKGAWTSQFGNMSVYLSDEIDDPNATFIAYQVKCSEEVAAKIISGAKVKVTGKLTNFNGTPETVSKGEASIELEEEAKGTPVTATLSAPSVKVGETATITAEAGEGETFTYASASEAVATVSPEGVVTGVAPGKALITITSNSGRKGYVTITVTAANAAEFTNFTDVSGTLGESGYSYGTEKGSANNAPTLNNSVIRVYQKGAIFTVFGNSSAKALASLTIASDGNSAGEGPFKYVYGASETSVGAEVNVEASSWKDHKVTLTFEGTDVRYFKLTTTGTTSSTRVYVKALTLTFAE